MLIVDDVDPFDPRLWRNVDYDYRIYLDNNECYFAHVSENDIDLANLYKWHPKIDIRSGKIYARRGSNVYLHRVIMVRQCMDYGNCPPTNEHFLVDHLDGDALNCRRENLRWATYWENNNNTYGQYHKQHRWDF